MELKYCLGILGTSIFSFFLLKIVQYIAFIRKFRHLPQQKSNFILGDLMFFSKCKGNLVNWPNWRKFREQGFFVVWLSWYPIVVVIRHEISQKILRNSKILDRGWIMKAMTLGHENILTLGEKEWKIRSKMVASSYDNSILKTKFVPTIVDRTIRLCKELEHINGQPIRDLIGELVISIVLETTLELTDVDPEKTKAIHGTIRDCVNSLGEISSKPQLSVNILFKTIARIFNFPIDKHNPIEEIIEKRLAEKIASSNNNTSNPIRADMKPRSAFLDHMIDHLIQSGDNKSAKLSSQDLVNETMNLIFISSDTLTSTMVYVLYNLAKNPLIQEKVYQEILESANNETETGKFDCFPLLTQCIKESLRLQSTTSGTSRALKEDIQIGQYVIPKNTFIQIRMHALHNDENVFPEPEKFDPSRFSPENVAKIPPGAFVPFGDGPRRCLGGRSALLEMHIVLSHILKQFRVYLIDSEEIFVKHTIINSMFNRQPKFKFVKRDWN